MTSVLLAFLLVALFVLPPLIEDTVEEPTPRFLQSRGVRWRVMVEEPIPFVEIEPIMLVFTGQVDELFNIRTYGVLYEHIEDDGVFNYSDFGRRRYASFQPPDKGPVEIPIYFLTGYGWKEHPPMRIPAWAVRTPQYYGDSSSLLFRITIAKESEETDYVGLTANRVDNLMIMLHEFGHNMGLKDLYLGGDVQGCDGLPVVMSSVMNLDREFQDYETPPRFGGLIMNRTWNIRPGYDGDEPYVVSSIEEAYLENNTLYFVSYNMLERSGGETVRGNAHVSIFDLNQIREMWTMEEAAFIGMDGRFSYSCPQEFK